MSMQRVHSIESKEKSWHARTCTAEFERTTGRVKSESNLSVEFVSSYTAVDEKKYDVCSDGAR